MPATGCLPGGVNPASCCPFCLQTCVGNAHSIRGTGLVWRSPTTTAAPWAPELQATHSSSWLLVPSFSEVLNVLDWSGPTVDGARVVAEQVLSQHQVREGRKKGDVTSPVFRFPCVLGGSEHPLWGTFQHRKTAFSAVSLSLLEIKATTCLTILRRNVKG